MASFLDKAGLTKFWELIKQYLSSSNYINNELLPTFDNQLDEKLRDNTYNILDIVRYIKIPHDGITFNYIEDIKKYSANNNESEPYIRILLKYFQKKLLLNYIKDRNTPIDLVSLLNITLTEDNSEMYLGRLPEHEIYPSNDKIYSRISFDIYLAHKELNTNDLYSGYILKLIPVSVSNGYTLNFITGELMLRYLGYSNKTLNSNKYYGINLVTDSPFDFRNYTNFGGEVSMSISHLVQLNNRTDITYTIRYPRYLNGLLTFLKGREDGSTLELADKTPEVVDGTYNEVVLTPNMSLFMYGDINIDKKDFPISEEIRFNISSTQDTTNKRLTLKGNIYMIYGLLNTLNISNNKEIDSIIGTRYFTLFQSEYIGSIIFNDNLFIPFDPLNKYLLLYKRLFNNTGIYTAIAGIHFIGNNPYITPNIGKKGIFSNFTEAYRNCNRLTILNLYVYLDGDLSLDSELKDYHIENAVESILYMIEGSNNLRYINLIPASNAELSSSEFNKFSNLLHKVVERLRLVNPDINTEIKSRLD